MGRATLRTMPMIDSSHSVGSDACVWPPANMSVWYGRKNCSRYLRGKYRGHEARGGGRHVWARVRAHSTIASRLVWRALPLQRWPFLHAEMLARARDGAPDGGEEYFAVLRQDEQHAAARRQRIRRGHLQVGSR